MTKGGRGTRWSRREDEISIWDKQSFAASQMLGDNTGDSMEYRCQMLGYCTKYYRHVALKRMWVNRRLQVQVWIVLQRFASVKKRSGWARGGRGVKFICFFIFVFVLLSFLFFMEEGCLYFLFSILLSFFFFTSFRKHITLLHVWWWNKTGPCHTLLPCTDSHSFSTSCLRSAFISLKAIVLPVSPNTSSSPSRPQPLFLDHRMLCVPVTKQ